MVIGKLFSGKHSSYISVVRLGGLRDGFQPQGFYDPFFKAEEKDRDKKNPD